MQVIRISSRLQRTWWPVCSPHHNMFNLMSNCCTWFSKFQEPIRPVTLLVVGLDKAGKTSSIRGMLRVPHAVECGPTQGCVRNQTRVENYLVTLLDVGGSAGVWGDFYGEAHGIIFVVDSSDRPRMKEVKEVLTDLLKQPRVAGKPILVLANKQDKMKALLGSDLTEMLSLEKLVNQSRCLCHIEPCSALMDIRRRSDRKTLRGLRWLLRAVCLDYLQLSTRVVQDSKSPLGPPERTASKNKRERLRGSQCDMKSKDNKDKDMKSKDHKDKDNKDKDMKSKDKAKRSKGEMLQKEQTLKKKMKKSARRKKSLVEANEDKDKEQEEEEEEEEDLLPPSSKSRPKGKTKVNEETLEVPEWTHEDDEPLRADGRRSKKKKKKKKKKVKKRSNNKINTEEMSHHVHLPATLDLYRKAILALKERQAERQ
ncbi:ADP-ribosylation factor-like protein 13A isoform X2 [Nerophis lumbriciformis]|uniref:ADP-ribosylation factor-like protein 13A isoform X2 n=2 Tax=Nerophis lumbriciformis TaxID=546530 RepID=UPI002ADFC6C7|nr:ADP-ribosylation factor-like protein 13B isoform X2 [Nerophis lumbriciformis]